METIILVIHVFICLAIIGLVLIQHGKGADMGTGFGAGASATVFGAAGSASFMSRLTTGFLLAFFASSIVLAVLAGRQSESSSVVESVMEQVAPAVESDVPMVPTGEENQDPASSESDVPTVPAVGESAPEKSE